MARHSVKALNLYIEIDLQVVKSNQLDYNPSHWIQIPHIGERLRVRRDLFH